MTACSAYVGRTQLQLTCASAGAGHVQVAMLDLALAPVTTQRKGGFVLGAQRAVLVKH
jgi:hypothetical protein